MKVLNLFTRLVGKVKTTDSQSGYRAYSRRAIEGIKITEEEFSIVKESLRRELTLSEAKVNLIREEIEGFEKRYEMSSGEFVDKFERGGLGDAQDYFEWWGLVRGLKKIEEQIGRIKIAK